MVLWCCVDGEGRGFCEILEPLLCNAALEKGECWMSSSGSQSALEVTKVSVSGWLLSWVGEEMDWLEFPDVSCDMDIVRGWSLCWPVDLVHL
jgi:hypothetical protein